MKKKLNIFKKVSLFVCFVLLLIPGLTACGEKTQQEAAAGFETEVLSSQEIAKETELLTEQETGKETESLTEQEASKETEASSEQESQKKEEASTEQKPAPKEESESGVKVEKDGSYTSKEEVAAYLNQYGELPSNFITKKEAKKLGWVSNEGNLGEVAPGKSIGGDYFGNYEGLLPEKDGRDYYECDINTDGSYRGAERIVFSNDGLIYYTGDHYESFELLYGAEELI